MDLLAGRRGQAAEQIVHPVWDPGCWATYRRDRFRDAAGWTGRSNEIREIVLAERHRPKRL